MNLNKIRVVDIPGHQTCRGMLFEELPNAKAILFLVDATNRDNIYNSASYLYEMFNKKSFEKIPLLIVSTKRDLQRSASATEVKNELIKEIERIKISKRSHTN